MQVIPVSQAGAPIGEIPFTRTGLLGFVGPVRRKNKDSFPSNKKVIICIPLLSETVCFSGQSGVCSWEN